jgi:hypothetical protein
MVTKQKTFEFCFYTVLFLWNDDTYCIYTHPHIYSHTDTTVVHCKSLVTLDTFLNFFACMCVCNKRVRSYTLLQKTYNIQHMYVKDLHVKEMNGRLRAFTNEWKVFARTTLTYCAFCRISCVQHMLRSTVFFSIETYNKYIHSFTNRTDDDPACRECNLPCTKPYICISIFLCVEYIQNENKN